MKNGMKLCSVLLAGLMCASVSIAAVTVVEKGEGNAFKGPDGKYHKALVVVWDGARGDVVVKSEIAPNLNQLAKAGVSTFTAYTGGHPNDEKTKTPTVTACGFMNIFTGVFGDKHKIMGNNAKDPNWKEYPSIFNRLKTASGGKAFTIGFFGWKPTWDRWVSLEDTQHDIVVAKDEVDRDCFEQITALLNGSKKIDFFFYEAGEPDHQGHGSGFSAENPNYVKAIQKLDAQIPVLLDAIKTRRTFNQENWMILVTTDHGGINKSHGGQSASERSVFIVASSPSIRPGTVAKEPTSNVDVAPTVLKHFGIPVKADWKFEGKSLY